jgi:4-hydroxybenzoate polyprenyltransferase
MSTTPHTMSTHASSTAADASDMARRVPLCVDLDGTLSRSDTLHESFLLMLKASPRLVFQLPGWLRKGKAHFKAEVAARTQLDAALLPMNEEFLAWLRAERAQGRSLILVTAAHQSFARAVADHVGIFDDVIATHTDVNLAGEAKRAELVRRFGERGFDYAGNDTPDLHVWRSARQAILVDASRGLERQARKISEVARVFKRSGNPLRHWAKALRVHQWVKNALLFVPMLLAHQFTDAAVVTNVAAGFVAFCLCASSVYILNDLWDLQSDRRHPRKCLRPFASAAIPVPRGLAVGALLLTAAGLIAVQVGWLFVAALGVYYLGTLLYSFLLKRASLVDVMALSGLYTMRILAGAAAADIAPSFWLLALSVFMFLSLAIVKRYAELDMIARQGKTSAAGRAYEATDLPVLLGLGTASGYCSILVLALYINSDQSRVLYARPEVLWMICPLMLYWMSRVWVLAHRGMMHDDPIVFALKDKISLVVGALIAAAALAAL